MFKKIFTLLIACFCISCATTESANYDAKEFDTKNYQTNIDNAVDFADVLQDFDQNKIPKASLNGEDLSKLVQANLYFNQGEYAKAYGFFYDLALKYKDPRIIYKTIICLEHISATPEQTKQLSDMTSLFIQVDPDSKLAKLFQIKIALSHNNWQLAKTNTDFLLTSNKANARAILLFISSILVDNFSNDMAENDTLSQYGNYIDNTYRNYPEASLLAAISYALANNETQLIKEFSFIHSHYPNWQVSFYWISAILGRSNNALIIKLVDLHPDLLKDPLAENIYVGALFKTNQTTKLRQYFTPDLTSESITKKNNALLGIGITEAYDGDYVKANQYLTQYKSSDDISVTNAAGILIATIYDNQNNYIMAIQYYKQVVDSNSYLSSVAVLMLIKDYLMVKDYANADKQIEVIAKTANFTQEQTILLKSSFYLASDEESKAFQLIKTNYPQYTKEKHYLYQYASLASLTKQTTLAISLYKEYIKLAPEDPFGYNDIAYVYANQTRDYKAAKKYADKAFELAPLDPMVLDTIGWTYYRLGHYAQAAVYLNDAYIATGNPETGAHLQTVYHALHKPELASQIVILDKQVQERRLKQDILRKAILLLIHTKYGISVN